MEIIEAFQNRKSIRGYKPDLVPQDVLRQIFSFARRVSSDVNAQPWHITVITGEVLENIRKANVAKLVSGEAPYLDVATFRYEGKYRQRQIDLAIQLFGLMGITREDKEKRTEWLKRGFRFFDAPAAIILSAERSIMDLRSQFDCGAITTAICLAALHYGLGTCVEDQGISYPDVVRKHAGIPDIHRIISSIAIGYPDWDFPANKLHSERETVDNIVSWCGFA
ncbi:nitroreductase [Chloroflexota bacterium]